MDKNHCLTEWVIEYLSSQPQCWCISSECSVGWYLADIRHYTFEDAMGKLTHSGRIVKDYRIRNTRTDEFVLGAFM